MTRPLKKRLISRNDRIVRAIKWGFKYRNIANVFNISEARVAQIAAFMDAPPRHKGRGQGKHGYYKYRTTGCRCEICVAAYNKEIQRVRSIVVKSKA